MQIKLWNTVKYILAKFLRELLNKLRKEIEGFAGRNLVGLSEWFIEGAFERFSRTISKRNPEKILKKKKTPGRIVN